MDSGIRVEGNTTRSQAYIGGKRIILGLRRSQALWELRLGKSWSRVPSRTWRDLCRAGIIIHEPSDYSAMSPFERYSLLTAPGKALGDWLIEKCCDKQQIALAQQLDELATSVRKTQQLFTEQLEQFAKIESILPEQQKLLSRLIELCRTAIAAYDRGDVAAAHHTYDEMLPLLSSLESVIKPAHKPCTWTNVEGRVVPWPEHPVHFTSLSPEQQAEGLKAARAMLRESFPFQEAMMSDEQIAAELADLDLREVVLASVEDNGRRHDC